MDTGRQWSQAELVGPVWAGVFLLLALRAAVTGGGAGQVMLWLACSGPAHLFDLARRVRRWPTK